MNLSVFSGSVSQATRLVKTINAPNVCVEGILCRRVDYTSFVGVALCLSASVSRYPPRPLGMVVRVMCPRLAHPRIVSAVVGMPRARSCLAMYSAPCLGSGCLAMVLGSGGLVHRLMVRAWSSSSCWRSAAQSSSDKGCAW